MVGPLAAALLLASCSGRQEEPPSECTAEEDLAGRWYWTWADGSYETCIDTRTPLSEACKDPLLWLGPECPESFEQLWQEVDDTGYGTYAQPFAYHCFDADGNAEADTVVVQRFDGNGTRAWVYWFSPVDGTLMALERHYYYPLELEPKYCCAGRRTDRVRFGEWWSIPTCARRVDL
ncbi:MAG: hypothetical protein H6738_08805 [Alphaproteobacteria bacterium]|nr:hypothetical protein [Alphaproteobacteria bacterium]